MAELDVRLTAQGNIDKVGDFPPTFKSQLKNKTVGDVLRKLDDATGKKRRVFIFVTPRSGSSFLPTPDQMLMDLAKMFGERDESGTKYTLSLTYSNQLVYG